VLELTPHQVALLEGLLMHEFRAIAFPLYASRIGVRKGNCAALLEPVAPDGLRVFGEPSWLVENNLSVRVTRGGKQWFVWKKKEAEATPDRLAELARFTAELSSLLITA
jgi:hypothetical protein